MVDRMQPPPLSEEGQKIIDMMLHEAELDEPMAIYPLEERVKFIKAFRDAADMLEQHPEKMFGIFCATITAHEEDGELKGLNIHQAVAGSMPCVAAAHVVLSGPGHQALHESMDRIAMDTVSRALQELGEEPRKPKPH